MSWQAQQGAVVGGYRLAEQLGRGGFGEVWRVERVTDGAPFALKLLRMGVDPSSRRRFDREAAVLGSLRHPNIVSMVERGYSEELGAWLVLDYLSGATLSEWGRQGRSLDEVVAVGRQIASALLHAHQRGIAHRDLKPANVIVTPSAGGPHVTVLDFGIAKLANRQPVDITKTGEVIGTPGFMSPEQLRGRRDIGPATDQYCLGVILFELLMGRHPYEADSAFGLGMAHLTEPVPDLDPHVPEQLRDVVRRLLAKDPAGRFGNMSDVVHTLHGDPAPPPSSAQLGREATTARRTGAGAIALGALLLVALAAVVWWNREEERASVVPQRANPPGFVKPTDSTGEVKDDETAKPAQVDTAAVRGCVGSSPGFAFRQFEGNDALTFSRIATYVPKSFDPENDPAIVVMLQRGGAHAGEAEIVENYSFDDLAERENWILVVPADDALIGTSWAPYGGALVGAWEDVEVVRNNWDCLRSVPVFVFGAESGAEGADWMLCKGIGEFSAVVVTEHSWSAEEWNTRPCVPKRRAPYLHLVQLNNSFDPVDGGPNCESEGGKSTVIRSLDDQQQHWREAYGCEDEQSPIAAWQYPDGSCYTWQRCEVPYATCKIDGGKEWPGGPKRSAEFLECAGEPAQDFPYHDVVAQFFDQHRDSALANEGGADE